MSINENSAACVELIARVLIRAFWIGIIILGIWFIFFLIAEGAAFKIHEGLFGITSEQIILINYGWMGIFKLFLFSVFLIPYIAIRWAMKGNSRA